MYRVQDDFDTEHVCNMAALLNIRPVYRLARCEHGKTSQQYCQYCEAGYVYDMHAYALTGPIARDGNGRALIAVTDDAEYVVYIPARYQARVNRVLASHTA